MKHFTKIVPRDIENMYLDFESFFSLSILHAESRCYAVGMGEYPNINNIRYLKENKIFEAFYAYVINEIKKQILLQFKAFRKKQFSAYIELQRLDFMSYDPNKRKKELFRDYLVLNIAHGDDCILTSDNSLTDYQKSMARLAFINYSSSYYLLTNEFTRLVQDFINFSARSHFQYDMFHKNSVPVQANEPKSKPSHTQPTGPVKAVFFYYLHQSKHIHFPQRSNFQELMHKHQFSGAWRYVYDLFVSLTNGTSDILNKSNIKMVIPLLADYSLAVSLAVNDLSQNI